MEGDKAKEAFNKSVDEVLMQKRIKILVEKEETEKKIKEDIESIQRETGIDWIWDTDESIILLN